jgi:hypothetical protein
MFFLGSLLASPTSDPVLYGFPVTRLRFPYGVSLLQDPSAKGSHVLALASLRTVSLGALLSEIDYVRLSLYILTIERVIIIGW